MSMHRKLSKDSVRIQDAWKWLLKSTKTDLGFFLKSYGIPFRVSWSRPRFIECVQENKSKFDESKQFFLDKISETKTESSRKKKERVRKRKLIQEKEIEASKFLEYTRKQREELVKFISLNPTVTINIHGIHSVDPDNMEYGYGSGPRDTKQFLISSVDVRPNLQLKGQIVEDNSEQNDAYEKYHEKSFSCDRDNNITKRFRLKILKEQLRYLGGPYFFKVYQGNDKSVFQDSLDDPTHRETLTLGSVVLDNIYTQNCKVVYENVLNLNWSFFGPHFNMNMDEFVWCSKLFLFKRDVESLFPGLNYSTSLSTIPSDHSKMMGRPFVKFPPELIFGFAFVNMRIEYYRYYLLEAYNIPIVLIDMILEFCGSESSSEQMKYVGFKKT